MTFMLKYLMMFIMLGSIIEGSAQDKKPIIKLSVSEAQAFALQNNREIQSSKIDIRIADKQVWEALATGLPQFNLAANYLHQFKIPQLNFGPSLRLDLLPDAGFITKK